MSVVNRTATSEQSWRRKKPTPRRKQLTVRNKNALARVTLQENKITPNRTHSFRILFLFRIICTFCRWRDYNQQKAVIVVKHHYRGCQLNVKRASMQKYFRGLGNLCSSATYINFLTPFCTVMSSLCTRTVIET